jgi:hypothetical protein
MEIIDFYFETSREKSLACLFYSPIFFSSSLLSFFAIDKSWLEKSERVCDYFVDDEEKERWRKICLQLVENS